jgi:hypothetical protein
MTTPNELDEAVRAAAEPYVQNGEVIVTWVVLAATRNYRDGGSVVVLPGESGMPLWTAKGIVHDALDEMRMIGSRIVDDTSEDPGEGFGPAA